MAEPDHANTCKPVNRVYTGFFARRGASANVDADPPRLDQISVFPESGEPPSAVQSAVC